MKKKGIDHNDISLEGLNPKGRPNSIQDAHTHLAHMMSQMKNTDLHS
jgi:hypothetical protein